MNTEKTLPTAHEQIPTWTRNPGAHGLLPPLRESNFPLIEAHQHMVNFTQETPGGTALIYVMDQANVGIAVIFGWLISKVNVPIDNLMIDGLLTLYSNLYVDYSWISHDVIICLKGRSDPDWLVQTEKYRELICLGSDLIVKPEQLRLELQHYDVFLDRLCEKAHQDLCWQTDEKLYSGIKKRVQAGQTVRVPDWEAVRQ